MKRVDIKVGFYCNNLCKFCVQGRKRDYLPAKECGEIEKALAEAYDQGNEEVVFTGGEPSLHPDFFELVRLAKKIGYKEIQIQTNGRVFAYSDVCLKAINAGVTQFSPALHGHVAKIHDFLTNSEGSFEQTVKGIKNLKDLNQYVLTNTVITTKNYQDLPRLAELLVKLGADQFQFAFIHIIGTAKDNQDWIAPRKTDIMPYVKRGLDIGLQAGKKVSTEAIPYCFMQGYEECVAESFIPQTRIYDAGFIVKDYSKYRATSGKAKRKECEVCIYYPQCEGPWKEYVELFGWEEFKPIS